MANLLAGAGFCFLYGIIEGSLLKKRSKSNLDYLVGHRICGALQYRAKQPSSIDLVCDLAQTWT